MLIVERCEACGEITIIDDDDDACRHLTDYSAVQIAAEIIKSGVGEKNKTANSLASNLLLVLAVEKSPADA